MAMSNLILQNANNNNLRASQTMHRQGGGGGNNSGNRLEMSRMSVVNYENSSNA